MAVVTPYVGKRRPHTDFGGPITQRSPKAQTELDSFSYRILSASLARPLSAPPCPFSRPAAPPDPYAGLSDSSSSGDDAASCAPAALDGGAEEARAGSGGAGQQARKAAEAAESEGEEPREEETEGVKTQATTNESPALPEPPAAQVEAAARPAVSRAEEGEGKGEDEEEEDDDAREREKARKKALAKERKAQERAERLQRLRRGSKRAQAATGVSQGGHPRQPQQQPPPPPPSHRQRRTRGAAQQVNEANVEGCGEDTRPTGD